MVFHAVLRYPSVRNRMLDRNNPVHKLTMALLWAGLSLGNCYENEEKESDSTYFKMEPDWREGMSLLVNLMTLSAGIFFCARLFPL